MKVITIGIAGGSGSGKTTIARKIIDSVGADRICLLEMDSYYRDLSHLPVAERAATNFDHPSSIDIELFLDHIIKLKKGMDIDKPEYDFVIHTRKNTTNKIKSKSVVFLEGILLYENSDVRNNIDIKLYVDTPSDIRFIRRLSRDIDERGRSTDSVIKQYYKNVRPMHMTFVEPTREYADIIIPWQGYNEVATDMVISRIESCLAKREEEENFMAPHANNQDKEIEQSTR